MLRVGVCGLGKLGVPIAVTFAAAGVPVIGYDVDAVKVHALALGRSPVDETGIAELLAQRVVAQMLDVTNFLPRLVECSDVCIFVTPTPSRPDGGFNHGALLDAMREVAAEAAYRRRKGYGLIVASTVMPGFLGGEGRLTEESAALDHWLAYKPEFIALGTVVRDLRHPDLILVGAESDAVAARVEEIYRSVVINGAPVKRMTLVEAELAKISLNCAVTARISFANQVALVARRLGADAARVLDAVGEDRRIGHAALKPGLPFGGPCFPRDNRMFMRMANDAGAAAPMADATDFINHLALRDIIARLPAEGDVGILGLAYKPGTSITEESAGERLRKVLEDRGRAVKAHDVRAPHADTIEEVCACSTVVVACAWPEYEELVLPLGTKLIDPGGAVRTWTVKLEKRSEVPA